MDSFSFMITFLLLSIILILLITFSVRFKKLSSPFLMMLALKGILSFFISNSLSFAFSAICALILIIIFTKTLYKINKVNAAIILATSVSGEIKLTIVFSILALLLLLLSIKDERIILSPSLSIAFSILLCTTYYLPLYVCIILSIVITVFSFFMQDGSKKNDT